MQSSMHAGCGRGTTTGRPQGLLQGTARGLTGEAGDYKGAHETTAGDCQGALRTTTGNLTGAAGDSQGLIKGTARDLIPIGDIGRHEERNTIKAIIILLVFVPAVHMLLF